MVKLNQLIHRILQVSSDHLMPQTLQDLENNQGSVSNITYYKKDIGEESSVGYFIVCNEDTLEQDIPDDLRLILTLGAAMGAYYVEVDEMFEMCDLFPYYNQSL